MNRNTGAIKKIPGPTLFTLVDETSEATISISYKLKIKHVCPSCQYAIEESIVLGDMKPIHHATECIDCKCRSVRQPYGYLCSLCSLIKKACARCLQPYNEYQGSEDPIDMVLNVKMKWMMSKLPTYAKRAPMRSIFQMWKLYKKGVMDIHKIRDKVYKQLKFLYYFYKSK